VPTIAHIQRFSYGMRKLKRQTSRLRGKSDGAWSDLLNENTEIYFDRCEDPEAVNPDDALLFVEEYVEVDIKVPVKSPVGMKKLKVPEFSVAVPVADLQESPTHYHLMIWLGSVGLQGFGNPHLVPIAKESFQLWTNAPEEFQETMMAPFRALEGFNKKLEGILIDFLWEKIPPP